jgi:hypothetical protein
MLVVSLEMMNYTPSNLTPSPFPTREGEKFKASLLAGERFGERFVWSIHVSRVINKYTQLLSRKVDATTSI